MLARAGSAGQGRGGRGQPPGAGQPRRHRRRHSGAARCGLAIVLASWRTGCLYRLQGGILAAGEDTPATLSSVTHCHGTDTALKSATIRPTTGCPAGRRRMRVQLGHALRGCGRALLTPLRWAHLRPAAVASLPWRPFSLLWVRCTREATAARLRRAYAWLVASRLTLSTAHARAPCMQGKQLQSTNLLCVEHGARRAAWL